MSSKAAIVRRVVKPMCESPAERKSRIEAENTVHVDDPRLYCHCHLFRRPIKECEKCFKEQKARDRRHSKNIALAAKKKPSIIYEDSSAEEYTFTTGMGNSWTKRAYPDN